MKKSLPKRQAKTRQQIAEEYGVVYRTLHRWIKDSDINLPDRKLVTPRYQDLIYQNFGYPDNMEEEDGGA